MSQVLNSLVACIPEQYQDIYGHPEFNGSSSRGCAERETWVRKIICEIQEKTGKKNLRVLDLGCAQGYYSFIASELGCSVLGVDKSMPHRPIQSLITGIPIRAVLYRWMAVLLIHPVPM